MPEIDFGAVAHSANWADDERMHAIFTAMRRDAPLARIEEEGFPPFWAVSKHADIVDVSRQHGRFLNEPRAVLQTLVAEERAAALTGNRNAVRSLVQMDDPDHRLYRALTQSKFLASSLRKLEGDIRGLATEYVDRMVERGGACDFVRDVAAWYPLRVIMTLLGVPREDEPLMLKLTQELFGPEDPDTQRGATEQEMVQALFDFADYFNRLTEDRRRAPRDDLASVIANAEIGGAPIPDFERNSYYTIIATAGHDTTSSSIAGGLLALLQHPDEMARVRAEPALLAKTADEMIRWTTPVKHFLRTATEPYELRGTPIAAGDVLMLLYWSGNRDEEVFDQPFRFRADRDPNPHLAFGFGAHLCLGRVLAKMEIEAIFGEILARVDDIELAGTPKLVQSSFVSGLKTLPIRYRVR